MIPKRIYKITLKKECNLEINSSGMENIKKKELEMTPEFNFLLYLNEHIYSASEIMITNLEKLVKAKNSKHYLRIKQIKLFNNEDCFILPNQFMKILKIFKVYQVTYTELQEIDSYKIMICKTMRPFKKFIRKIIPILEKIFSKCDEKQQLAYSIYPDQSLVDLDVIICSEIQKYSNSLQYLFNNFVLKINIAQFNKAKNKIIRRINLFYNTVYRKNNNLILTFSDKIGSELVMDEENIKMEYLTDNYKPTNIISNSTHYPTNNHFVDNRSVIKHHDSPICNLNLNFIRILLGLVILGFISLTISFIFIYRLYKTKKNKLKADYISEGIVLTGFQYKI